MFTAIIVLLLIVCVLLVMIVLIQPSKGGAAASIAGGISSQLMGVQKSSDLMEKLTWGFAVTVMVLALGSNFFLNSGDDGEGGINSVNVNKAQEQAPVSSPQNQPAAEEEEDR